MFVITVTVLAKAQPKQSGHFVFTDFENFSGWENNVIAFITGFINANYSFSCLDAATHISEEIPRPEINIPKALLTIPVIGVLSSLFYNISMVPPPFFDIPPFGSCICLCLCRGQQLRLDLLDRGLRYRSRHRNRESTPRIILPSPQKHRRRNIFAMYVSLHWISMSRLDSHLAISNGQTPQARPHSLHPTTLHTPKPALPTKPPPLAPRLLLACWTLKPLFMKLRLRCGRLRGTGRSLFQLRGRKLIRDWEFL